MRNSSMMFVLAGLLAVTAPSGDASAGSRQVPASIGSVPVTLVLPDGFCALDPALASDLRLLNLIRGAMAQVNEVLIVASACVELERWHKGEIETLNQQRQFLTPLQFLNETVPMDRAEYVKQACAAMRTTAQAEIDAALSKASERVEAVMEAIKVNESKSIGVLAEDSNGCYAGLLMKIMTEAGTPKDVAGVFFLTAVRSKLLSVNAYDVYSGPESFDKLLAAQKELARELAGANP